MLYKNRFVIVVRKLLCILDKDILQQSLNLNYVFMYVTQDIYLVKNIGNKRPKAIKAAQ